MALLGVYQALHLLNSMSSAADRPMMGTDGYIRSVSLTHASMYASLLIWVRVAGSSLLAKTSRNSSKHRLWT